MNKKSAGAALAFLMATISLSGAHADQTVKTTSCLTGEARVTIIEEGRSDVPTAPMITYEEQRANVARWTQENAACAIDGSKAPTETQAPAKPESTPKPITPIDPENGKDESTEGHYIPGSLTSQEQRLAESVNQERISQGISPLPVDRELSALARDKSRDMIDNRYFAHESPKLGKAAQMLKDAGYEFTSVGENIARNGSVEKAHAALMSSSGHRQNILGSQWTRMGIGIVNDANGFPYVTQLFAR